MNPTVNPQKTPFYMEVEMKKYSFITLEEEVEKYLENMFLKALFQILREDTKKLIHRL